VGVFCTPPRLVSSVLEFRQKSKLLANFDASRSVLSAKAGKTLQNIERPRPRGTVERVFRRLCSSGLGGWPARRRGSDLWRSTSGGERSSAVAPEAGAAEPVQVNSRSTSKRNSLAALKENPRVSRSFRHSPPGRRKRNSQTRDQR
jgi:hypothetical protein